MAMISAVLRIDDQQITQCLEEACDKMDTADGELVLEFSSVDCLEPSAVRALKALANKAEDRGWSCVGSRSTSTGSSNS
jgi:hypothetical protein